MGDGRAPCLTCYNTAFQRDNGRITRLAVAALIVVVVVAVAIDNRQEVDVGYVFGDVSAPL
jgi:uncharacterized integral membrane protein